MSRPKGEREERLETAARLALRTIRGELSPVVAEAALSQALSMEQDDTLDAQWSCSERLAD